jgi:hypothetical protein
MNDNYVDDIELDLTNSFFDNYDLNKTIFEATILEK